MTDKQKKLAAEIKAVCEANYEAGGDEIIECFTDQEIVERFATVAEAKEFCGLRVEMAMNARWGEDSDPEVNRPAWK